MKIGNTSFDSSVKKWTWSKFKSHFTKNRVVMNDLAIKNISLEQAYTSLTGKPVKTQANKSDDDVRKS